MNAEHFSRAGRAQGDFLQPEVVGGDDMVREPRGQPFDLFQRAEDERPMTQTELGGIELGDDVMDVEDDLCPAHLGNQCREHLEIRHRVHVDQVIAALEVLPGHLGHGAEEEPHDAGEIRDFASLVLFACLDPQDPHTMDDLLAWLPRAAEHDGIDCRAFLRQSLRIAHDAPVVLVERVCQHAHAEGGSVRHRRDIALGRTPQGFRYRRH